MKKSAMLKLDLLSRGVDFEKSPKGIGVYVKEEFRALFDARLSEANDLVLPPEIVLEGGIVAKTIYRPSSPYIVKEVEGSSKLFIKPSKEVAEVQFPPRPRFYSKITSSGIPMSQVGQLLGLDCLGIIINSYCSRVKKGKQCKFCNINATTGKCKDTLRDLDDIFETVEEAHKLHEFSLVNLTGGTFDDPELELVTYLETAKRIRETMGLSRLPGISSINPPSHKLLRIHGEGLVNANFDLVTYNLEVWNSRTLKKVCPGKYDLGGRKRYIASAKETMKILGEGHVGVIFTVGPWESVESIIDGSRSLAGEGILPIPVVFHPGKGAEYSWMGTTSTQDLLKLYRAIYEIYNCQGFITKSKPRVAGSERSFRNSLINESCMGYLN